MRRNKQQTTAGVDTIRQKAMRLDKRMCKICKNMFTPKRQNHWNCSPKCSYIADRISRTVAHGHTREEAIEHYGAMYDDPYRRIKRSRHRALVQVVYDYCEETGKQTFIHRDIVKLDKIQMTTQSLAACAADVRALRKTGNNIRIGNGKYVIEWHFDKTLLAQTTPRQQK
jgi:hypothetical protein